MLCAYTRVATILMALLVVCFPLQTKYSHIAEEQVSITYFYAGTKRVIPQVSIICQYKFVYDNLLLCNLTYVMLMSYDSWY